MAGVIPPLMLLAISIASCSRYVEGEDTTHVVGVRIVQLACVLLAVLALVPSRSRLFLCARLIQSIVLLLAWISKASVYALRSVHTSTTFRAYYTSSPWLYLGVETIFGIALQIPLYEYKLLPEWLILTGGLTDAAIISYTATQHSSISWLRHFAAHLLTTAVVPFAAHSFQKYKLVGTRAAAVPSTRSAANADSNSSIAKVQEKDPSSSVKATGSSKHYEDSTEYKYKNVDADSLAGGVLNTSTPPNGSMGTCDNQLAAHSNSGQALNPNPDSCINVAQPQLSTQLHGIPHQSVQSVPKHGLLHSNEHQEQKGKFTQPRSSQSNLLASLTQQAAADNHRGLPSYQSKLVAMKRTAAIKIRTDTHPSQLPADLATQLEASLKYICGASYSISNLAVRQGCVMITAEFQAATPSTTKAHKRGGSDPYNVMELAHSILPSLKSIICEKVRHLPEGEYVRLQVDDKVVRCYLDDQQAWQLAEGEGLSRRFEYIKLRFARPALLNQQDKAIETAPPQENSTSSRVFAYEHATSGSQGVLNPLQANKDRAQGILVEVMVQGVSRIAHASDCTRLVCGWQKHSGQDAPHDDTWWGSAPLSTKTTTASATTATTTTTRHSSNGSGSNANADAAPLKLLVRSRDTYYETHVLSCKETANNDVMVVTAHVAIPEHANTHHSGQKVPCIHLLTLELWSDELLISSTAAVTPPQAGASVKTENQQCWWWGSRPATVTAAMSDLQRVRDELCHLHDPDSVESYHELMYDLAMFMT